MKFLHQSNSLRNWVLEVSQNKKDWIKIDERVNDNNYQNPSNIATFNVNQTHEFYRYIQLKQTGVNSTNNYSTNIVAIEFYGKLMQNNK